MVLITKASRVSRGRAGNRWLTACEVGRGERVGCGLGVGSTRVGRGLWQGGKHVARGLRGVYVGGGGVSKAWVSTRAQKGVNRRVMSGAHCGDRQPTPCVASTYGCVD